MASSILRGLNGKGAVRTYIVVRVGQVRNGIGCYDARGEMVWYLRVTDQAQRDRAELLVIDCIDPAKKFKQPDWSFITNDDEVEGDDQ